MKVVSMKFTVGWAVLAASALWPVAQAQTHKVQPGLWENQVTIQTGDPVLDQMAADAGLRAGSDAAVIVRNSKRIGNGLQAVMTDRLNNTVSLIDKGYDTTLDALRELIAEHEKLEKGESVTNAQLLQIIYGLQTVTERLSGRQLQE